MDKLFDLIFSNIFVVIAVLGFLLSFLGNKKSGSRMPSFGGDTKSATNQPVYEPEDDNDYEDDEVETKYGRQQSPFEDARTTPVFSSSSRNEREDYATRFPSSIQSDVSYGAQTAAADGFSSRFPRNGRGEYQHAKTSDEQTLIEQARQGVIWSEILGPPRAKRPFRNR